MVMSCFQRPLPVRVRMHPIPVPKLARHKNRCLQEDLSVKNHVLERISKTLFEFTYDIEGFASHYHATGTGKVNVSMLQKPREQHGWLNQRIRLDRKF